MIRFHCRRTIVIAWLSLGWIAPLVGQDPAKPQPASATAVEGPARAELSLPGILTSKNAVELSVAPKTTQAFKVIKAVPFGSAVRTGDLLVEFNSEAFADQLSDQERAVVNAEIALNEGRRDYELLHQQYPLDQEQAELTWAQAQEDYKYFTETERPFEIRSTEQALKSAKDFLDYTHEELKQLEKMYKADDLTEESEEIVLRRARDDFERQRFSFERTQMQNERQKNVLQPRIEKQRQTAFRLAEIAYERSRLTLPVTLQKKKIELEKLEIDLVKAQRKLEELKADAQWFQVHAPQDGYVYYGKATNGKWEGLAEMKNKLRPNGAIQPNEIFMTVVDNSQLAVQSNVPEAEAPRVRPGQIGWFQPTSLPGKSIPVSVERRLPLPNSDGSFEMSCDLQPHDNPLAAGQNGTVKIVVYENQRAVLIPAQAVFTDEKNGGLRYVLKFVSEGNYLRTPVEVGVTMGDQLEILKGVSVGDTVLTEKPN